MNGHIGSDNIIVNLPGIRLGLPANYALTLVRNALISRMSPDTLQDIWTILAEFDILEPTHLKEYMRLQPRIKALLTHSLVAGLVDPVDGSTALCMVAHGKIDALIDYVTLLPKVYSVIDGRDPMLNFIRVLESRPSGIFATKWSSRGITDLVAFFRAYITHPVIEMENGEKRPERNPITRYIETHLLPVLYKDTYPYVEHFKFRTGVDTRIWCLRVTVTEGGMIQVPLKSRKIMRHFFRIDKLLHYVIGSPSSANMFAVQYTAVKRQNRTYRYNQSCANDTRNI
jgi:hypothetical protein